MQHHSFFRNLPPLRIVRQTVTRITGSRLWQLPVPSWGVQTTSAEETAYILCSEILYVLTVILSIIRL